MFTVLQNIIKMSSIMPQQKIDPHTMVNIGPPSQYFNYQMSRDQLIEGLLHARNFVMDNIRGASSPQTKHDMIEAIGQNTPKWILAIHEQDFLDNPNVTYEAEALKAIPMQKLHHLLRFTSVQLALLQKFLPELRLWISKLGQGISYHHFLWVQRSTTLAELEAVIADINSVCYNHSPAQRFDDRGEAVPEQIIEHTALRMPESGLLEVGDLRAIDNSTLALRVLDLELYLEYLFMKYRFVEMPFSQYAKEYEDDKAQALEASIGVSYEEIVNPRAQDTGS